MSRFEDGSGDLVSPVKHLRPPIRLSFSLFCADFKNLGAAISQLEKGGIDEFHFDVVDGHFARIISIGPTVVASLRDGTGLPFETHLATWEPDLFLDEVAESGSNAVTTQIEATPNAFRFVRRARELGLRVGFALNPATPIQSIEYLLDEIDVAQLMTVDAGFPGQRFVSQVIDKVRALRHAADRRGLALDIEVDGNINQQTIPEVVRAGANVLVLGTSCGVLNDLPNAGRVIREIRELAQNASCPAYASRDSGDE